MGRASKCIETDQNGKVLLFLTLLSDSLVASNLKRSIKSSETAPWPYA